jgi:hypothetical protein
VKRACRTDVSFCEAWADTEDKEEGIGMGFDKLSIAEEGKSTFATKSRIRRILFESFRGSVGTEKP